ncbi:uncharacterized protein LOC130808367 [Amaranthus tricolor]|uniref:uncharacterized protein LOC130808367 n=1 Tax=Amaranthus tricolor TaxID=29722 RepID=UPI002585C471|nr:uncharacterized protein LOC130808367 [Amaranthus tricolor]
MRSGPQLSMSQAQVLIKTISKANIDDALRDIDESKSSGLDRFSSHFFVANWDIIKEDVYTAILHFFNDGAMYSPINITSITLVLKITNASKPKHFRPTPCCFVLYKIIAKILMVRLQTVVAHLVDPAQSGFIPGRQSCENILLATDLIRGYNWANASPRCMLKVDMAKAYDSVE